MLVIVKMKNGTMYKGIKCGSDSGLVYLVNPCILFKDNRGKCDGLLESPVGNEVNGVRVLQIPIMDIEKIESSR